MAIQTLATGTSGGEGESFAYTADYDTVAQTIGLTLTGSGHAQLDVMRTATQTHLGTLSCDQYGATAGPLTNGASATPVFYDGLRKIVLGPGAIGVDNTGAALPTGGISAAVVGLVNPPKGTVPALGIGTGWSPNIDGPALRAPLARRIARALRIVREPSLARSVERCLRHQH